MGYKDVLVVDPVAATGKLLGSLLQREGYQTQVALNGAEALRAIEGVPARYGVVLVQMQLAMDADGLLAKIRTLLPEALLVALECQDQQQVFQACQQGASEGLERPFSTDRLLSVLRHKPAASVPAVPAAPVTSKHGIVGSSEALQPVLRLIDKVANSTASVLVTGESGTGKELVARAIHGGSARSNGPFVAVNCGAIPETLIESELFGHMKGAFTGATSDRPGLFELAEGGTLFLDEIGELPLSLQPKLLRVLQERELCRVGGGKLQRCDVRIVSATNKSLTQQVAQGGFREDLFYRLNVVEIPLPPLRERSEDIPLLVGHFCSKYGAAGQQLTPEVQLALKNYQYPGNIRELENIIERALVMANGIVTLADLPEPLQQLGTPSAAQQDRLMVLPEQGIALEDFLATVEQELIRQALERSGGRKMRAAALLGIEFRSFRYRLAKYGFAT